MIGQACWEVGGERALEPLADGFFRDAEGGGGGAQRVTGGLMELD